MKNWKPIFSVAIFIGMQAVGGIFLAILSLISGEEGMENFKPEMLAGITSVTGIVSVLLIGYVLKSIDFREAFHTRNWSQRHNWTASLLALGGAASGIVAVNLLSEQLELPDLMQAEFTGMSKSLIGTMSIALVAPVVEELIFRESIEGYLLRQGHRPWMAIVLSALLFGIIHLNPAQIPFAFLVGVILGVLYWRTGNVWLCTLVHILNNAQAVWMMATMGEEASEYGISEELGSPASVWGTLMVLALLCVALLRRFCQMYQPILKNSKTKTHDTADT